MAHYKSDIIDINLNTGNIHRSFLSHSIGQKDDDADRFGIRAFRDGVPQDLSGASCHAWFLNSQGTTIALTSYGTVSSNVAYVTLPPACYDYDGPFTLAIKIVGGGVSATVRIVDGMVDNINTGGAVTPTSAVPTYSEIIAQYDAMVAATAAANTAIAETFDATKEYPAGKYVINGGALYILPEGHEEDATWANTAKIEVKIGDEVTDLNDSLGDIVSIPMSTSLLTIESGGLAADGSNVTSSTRAKTQFFNASGIIKIEMTDDVYSFANAFAYEADASRGRRISSKRNGTNALICALGETETRIKVSFLYTSNSSHTMTSSDYTAIKNKLTISRLTDETLTRKGIPADAWATGEAVQLLRGASLQMYDTSGFGYAFGGLNSIGQRIGSTTTRLRVTDNNGKDTFFIKRGSSITVDSGYKFNVAQFNYIDNIYELIEMRSMGTDDFTAAQDCYVRISVGKSDNANLWESNDGVKSILTAGESALAALHYNLIGQTSLGLAEQLEENVYGISRLIDLTKSIPYTAAAYHAQYDNLVSDGLISRSAAYYCSGDTEHKWPLYTYTIKRNHDWLNASYNSGNYDGTNDLYERKKVLIVSGIHGSERATPSFLFEFINRLFNDPAYASLLVTYDWTIIPLANPWGYSHSLVNGSGKVYHGQASTLTGYTVYENNTTNKYNGGIRRNSDNIDINRDFSDGSGFQTEEAVYIRDVYLSEHFDYAFDFHQAYYNDNRCAFASLSYNATSAVKNVMFKATAKAGAETDVAASADTNIQPGTQTSFPWVGSNLATFRNYAGGYSHSGEGNINHTDHAIPTTICSELSTSCVPYSNTADPYNDVALRYGNTYLDNLIQNILAD